MNDHRAMNGAPNDWTNPSKCLVDKALERWSTTKMRADNTSVVIIMLDPPGPPKRDVLKACPSQLILENDEMDQQPLTEDKTFAMHDYCTRETVELNNIPSLLASGINRYEAVGYAHASTSSNMDVGYANSFAESYNSLLNANIGNENAYTYQLHEPETHLTHSEDTYSLTKLETRMEQFASRNSPSTLFSDYQQRYDERHQYDCITSSFLSPPCEILPNLEDSIQAVVSDVVEATPNSDDDHNYSNDINDSIVSERNASTCEMDTQPEASTSHETTNKNICSQMSSTSSAMNDDYVVNNVHEPAAALDETIQINEISSSSKENDEKTSNAINAMEKLTRSKTKDKFNQERRITRSNVLKPSDNGVGKHKVHDEMRKKLRSIGKKELLIQNENVITIPSRRNTKSSCTFSVDTKRTLRSDDLMSDKRLPSIKVKPVKPNRNRNTFVQSITTTSLFNITSETLREKIKPNQQTNNNSKPKNISKFYGKKSPSTAKQTSVSRLQRSKRLNR